MILDEILEATYARVESLPAEAGLRRAAASAVRARDFAGAIAVPGLQVIAEIKRRSPSAGLLADGLDPVELAQTYQRGGAAAISVLTEPAFFAGSLGDLRSVAQAVDLPVLRKDFIVDVRQVFESRAAGADAILLIVAAVGSRLTELLEAAGEAGLAALVEVHTEAEAKAALQAGAAIIGVNNRDLTTFVTDLAVAERVAAELPGGILRVAESGVATAQGARRMAAAGYDAILVGEALVRAADPAGLLVELRGER